VLDYVSGSNLNGTLNKAFDGFRAEIIDILKTNARSIQSLPPTAASEPRVPPVQIIQPQAPTVTRAETTVAKVPDNWQTLCLPALKQLFLKVPAPNQTEVENSVKRVFSRYMAEDSVISWLACTPGVLKVIITSFTKYRSSVWNEFRKSLNRAILSLPIEAGESPEEHRRRFLNVTYSGSDKMSNAVRQCLKNAKNIAFPEHISSLQRVVS